MSIPERVTTTPQGLSEYEDNVVIVLEGESDYKILAERLQFGQREVLEFEWAMGHDRVIAKVKERREEGDRRYFGLVDRDVLHKFNMTEALLQNDDEEFKRLNPMGEFIKVLHRWELENYLIIPRFLAEAISDDPKSPHDITAEEVSKILLQISEKLKPIAANAIATQEQKGHRPFTKKNNWADQIMGMETTEIWESCKNHYVGQISAGYDEKEAWFDEISARVKAFDGTENDLPEIRWMKANRIIDGKRILQFLKVHCNLGHSLRLKSLARKIRNQERLDQTKYLDQYLEDLMNEFESMTEGW